MPWVQQRRCLRRTLRESSRERPDGDGAGGGSSEAGRVLVAASQRRSASAAGRRTRVSGRRWLGLTDDWRRMTRAGVELSSAREGILTASFSWLQHGPLSRAGLLDERDAAPAGLELLGRAGVYVPRFLFPNPPSLSILFDLYSYSRARRLAPCGVSPPGLLPARAPSVVFHHLRRLSPPLLASRAHSIGFR